MRSSQVLLSVVVVAMLAACGGDDGGNAPDSIKKPTPDADAGTDSGEPDEPDSSSEVACIDQSFEQLMLFEEPAPESIREDDARGFFHTSIDATAGGMTPMRSYVYARFEDDGLQQVAISDEDAFDSDAWDIAFRRYVIRLNSGVSGPGKVTGARTAPMTEFEALDAEPEGLAYRTEQYFSESCDYVSDGSGIGAPATALASFWSYSGCVEMTGNVYVLALQDGRHVKLEVLAYYTGENQAVCDETGMVPTPSGAGNLQLRWAFID